LILEILLIQIYPLIPENPENQFHPLDRENLGYQFHPQYLENLEYLEIQ
jgi:hypothetical protein